MKQRSASSLIVAFSVGAKSDSFQSPSGTDGPPALSKDQIESLTLIVQYLNTYGGESIGQDPASASSLPEFWRMAFTERNLRFLPCSDDAGRVLSVNVMLNEWLEHIRLSSLYSSPAWQRTSGQLARNENLSDNDKRKLAMWLYSSILTVEEFADTSIWMVGLCSLGRKSVLSDANCGITVLRQPGTSRRACGSNSLFLVYFQFYNGTAQSRDSVQDGDRVWRR
jgi:hypothetical protein